MSNLIGVNVAGAGTHHPQFDSYIGEWRTIADCLNGQAAVKKARTRYLPKPEAWSTKRYEAYLGRAHFLNATYRTAVGMTGIAFNKPATYDVTGEMSYLLDDCDGEGADLDQLVRDAVTENVTFGRGGVLVDHTNENPDDKTMDNPGQVILRLFEHDKVINWRYTKGKLVLLVLRYEEDIDHDGFGQYKVVRYLEYRMIGGVCHVRLWTEKNDAGLPSVVCRDAPEEVSDLKPLFANGVALDRIPFCWFGSLSNDHHMDPAPLADIANTNIAMYQADADVSDSAFIAGQPTLVIAGVSTQFKKDNPGGVMLGSGEAIVLSGAGQSTPTANIITAPANTQSMALMDKREKQLAMLGAKLIERNGATKTATQAGNDAQTDNSILSQCVGNVESAMNQAFEFVKLYVGGDGNVSINQSYDEAGVDSAAFTAYMGAVQQGMMRFRDFLAWQQRNGLISNDDDIDDVEKELEDATPPGGVLANMQSVSAKVQGVDEKIDPQNDGDKDGEDS